MKILVIGATGKTGQKLLAQLSQTPHSIAGLIRDHNQIPLIEQFNAEPLLGDLADDMNVINAEFDVILFVAGSGGKNVQAVDYEGLSKTVDLMVANNIKRFLYLSSINIDKQPIQFIAEIKRYYEQRSEIIPAGLLKAAENQQYKTYLAMKTLAENKIIESPLNYTILRAGLLTQDKGTGKVSVTLGTLNDFGKISRDNVAQCFIEILENNNTHRKIFTILDGETTIQKAF
jgi:uncharacterized protein YbjT (DUF2867 family)